MMDHNRTVEDWVWGRWVYRQSTRDYILVEDNDTPAVLAVGPVGRVTEVFGGDYIIKPVGYDWDGVDVASDDMALIKAAPKLLAALKLLVSTQTSGVHLEFSRESDILLNAKSLISQLEWTSK